MTDGWDVLLADLVKLPRGFEMINNFGEYTLRAGEYILRNKRTHRICAWTPGGALRVLG